MVNMSFTVIVRKSNKAKMRACTQVQDDDVLLRRLKFFATPKVCTRTVL
jgi:hypothetical protein